MSPTMQEKQKPTSRVGEIAQWVEVLATKPDKLSLRPESDIVEGKNVPLEAIL